MLHESLLSRQLLSTLVASPARLSLMLRSNMRVEIPQSRVELWTILIVTHENRVAHRVNLHMLFDVRLATECLVAAITGEL